MMSSSSIINKLKDFDGYPKTLDDYRIRTLGGGAVTVISYAIMLLLFVLELNTFLTPDVTEELFVDTTREPKLQINLNITVPAISCKYLSLDAMDSSGEQHLQIEHNIYKVSLDKHGKQITEPEKEDIIKSGNNTKTEKKCGSCYGAESVKLNITCCNTCAEVKDAYMKRGWGFNHPEQIEQCKHLSTDNIFNEGCFIYGSMEVNRVGGSFHIAPGQSFSINHVHVHDIQPFSSTSFNTSHRIDHLSFGINIPGKTNPLDGTLGISQEVRMPVNVGTYAGPSCWERVKTGFAIGFCVGMVSGTLLGGFSAYRYGFRGAAMFQYYIKIVPTIYYYDYTGGMILTNQFSVTRHQKSESESAGMPPGIFFSYELAPIMVKYTEKKRSFGHFATNICAIIGGVFTVASLIDGFLYRSVQALQQKVEIGKVY